MVKWKFSFDTDCSQVDFSACFLKDQTPEIQNFFRDKLTALSRYVKTSKQTANPNDTLKYILFSVSTGNLWTKMVEKNIFDLFAEYYDEVMARAQTPWTTKTITTKDRKQVDVITPAQYFLPRDCFILLCDYLRDLGLFYATQIEDKKNQNDFLNLLSLLYPKETKEQRYDIVNCDNIDEIIYIPIGLLPDEQKYLRERCNLCDEGFAKKILDVFYKNRLKLNLSIFNFPMLNVPIEIIYAQIFGHYWMSTGTSFQNVLNRAGVYIANQYLDSQQEIIQEINLERENSQKKLKTI